MTRKELVARTKIAKMAGQDNRHLLNHDARHLQKPLGKMAGLTKLGFHLIGVQIGSASCTLHQHLYEGECVYILEGAGIARIGDTVVQAEDCDFIDYPAGCEAHDLRNTGSNILKYIIVG